MTLSRRRLLAGLGAVGALGTLSGVGTAAFLTDRETVAGAYRATELGLDRSAFVDPLVFAELEYGAPPETAERCIGIQPNDDSDDNFGPGYVWLRLCGGDGRLTDLLDADVTLTLPDGSDLTYPDGDDDSLTGAIAWLGSLDGIYHAPGEQTCLELSISVPETENQGDRNYLSGSPGLELTLEAYAQGAANNDPTNTPWTDDCSGTPVDDGPGNGGNPRGGPK